MAWVFGHEIATRAFEARLSVPLLSRASRAVGKAGAGPGVFWGHVEEAVVTRLYIVN